MVLKSLAKISHDLVYGHQNIIDHDGYKTLDAIISAKLDLIAKHDLACVDDVRNRAFKEFQAGEISLYSLRN